MVLTVMRAVVFAAWSALFLGPSLGFGQAPRQEPRGVREYRAETMPEDELIDWTIVHPDGSEEGNVVGKFLDTLRP